MVHSFLLFSFPFQFFVIKGSLCFLLLSFAPFLVKQWKRVLFLLFCWKVSTNSGGRGSFVVVLYLLQSELSTEKAVLVCGRIKNLTEITMWYTVSGCPRGCMICIYAIYVLEHIYSLCVFTVSSSNPSKPPNFTPCTSNWVRYISNIEAPLLNSQPRNVYRN